MCQRDLHWGVCRLGSAEEVQKVIFELELLLTRAETMGLRNAGVLQVAVLHYTEGLKGEGGY